MTTMKGRGDRKYGSGASGGRPLPPLTERDERMQEFLREVREADKESRVRIGDAIKQAVSEALEAAKEKSGSAD